MTPTPEVWGNLVFARVSVGQAATSAMFAQVLIFALLIGFFVAITRQRTEVLSSSVPFLVVALVGDCLVDPQMGWYVLLLWLVLQAVYRLAPAILDVFRG